MCTTSLKSSRDRSWPHRDPIQVGSDYRGVIPFLATHRSGHLHDEWSRWALALCRSLEPRRACRSRPGKPNAAPNRGAIQNVQWNRRSLWIISRLPVNDGSRRDGPLASPRPRSMAISLVLPSPNIGAEISHARQKRQPRRAGGCALSFRRLGLVASLSQCRHMAREMLSDDPTLIGFDLWDGPRQVAQQRRRAGGRRRGGSKHRSS